VLRSLCFPPSRCLFRILQWRLRKGTVQYLHGGSGCASQSGAL
jgi:hypothetical protein